MRTLLVVLMVLVFVGCGDNKYKDYIIEHADEFRVIDSWDGKRYKMDMCSCESSYFTDVTIGFRGDSSYFVVFWGDRDSWKWDFKKDYDFSVDVPYQRHIKKDVSRDIKILELFGE